MKRTLTDKVRIYHVLDAIEEVDKYLATIAYEDFVANSEKKFATIKQIEIIGEACNRMSSEFKDSHSEINWKEINGFRNISIHEYFGIDYQIVWEIAQNDLPTLKEKLEKASREL
jgi:uncharacterized protein with HEPN domain